MNYHKHTDGWVHGDTQCPQPDTAKTPVLVIDPDDDNTLDLLMDAILDHGYTFSAEGTAGLRGALRSLLPVPKPDEPKGLGAIVKDSSGTLWVRVCLHERCNSWRPFNEDTSDVELPSIMRKRWEDVPAKKVLFNGDSGA